VTPGGQGMTVPENAVFRAGGLIFTDEGIRDDCRFAGVYDLEGHQLDILPLAIARVRYAPQFMALAAEKAASKDQETSH
jgi:hypothetical protein